MTRRIELDPDGLLTGDMTLPDGVTYLALPGIMPRPMGEFPHCRAYPDPEVCRDSLYLSVIDGADDADPNLLCTREKGHPLPHVSHVGPGFPLAAWSNP